MKNKILFILLILGIPGHVRSQEKNHAEPEKKLVSLVRENLLKNVIGKSAAATLNFSESAFCSVIDTLDKYNTIRCGIISKACYYLGVSYRYGQSSEKGFDCSGYVKFIYKIFGITLPHSSYIQYQISRHIETADARSGDLVFFITRGKKVSHVGIYLGNNQFIHSPGSGRTVSIDSLNTGYYNRRLVGFGSVL